MSHVLALLADCLIDDRGQDPLSQIGHIVNRQTARPVQPLIPDHGVRDKEHLFAFSRNVSLTPYQVLNSWERPGTRHESKPTYFLLALNPRSHCRPIVEVPVREPD